MKPVLYLRVMRLDHWFKNVFVLIGSIAAIYYFKIGFSLLILGYIILGLLLACLVSSGNYIINEVLDAPFDKHHPTKRNRPIPSGQIRPRQLIVLFILLICIASLISLMIRWQLFLALAALLGAGLIYNLRPIRAKDIPFIDVVSESVNNPIRILIGWFAVFQGRQWPPWELLILLWCFGAFLMTGKRLAEFRYLGSNSSRYRSTFKYYSGQTLTVIMTIYAVASLLLYIQLALAFKRELFYTSPLAILFIIWFFKLTFEQESIVKEPEKIYKRPIFFLYSLLSFMLFIYVSFL